MTKFDLTHARHDPAHCLAPGLFRSLKRGERKTNKLDVIYEFGNGQRIEFSGPEPLGFSLNIPAMKKQESFLLH